jgi:hypothetical protein
MIRCMRDICVRVALGLPLVLSLCHSNPIFTVLISIETKCAAGSTINNFIIFVSSELSPLTSNES